MNMQMAERWAEARDALSTVVETAVRYDVTGVELHFLNNEHTLTVQVCSNGAAIYCLCLMQRSLPATSPERSVGYLHRA